MDYKKAFIKNLKSYRKENNLTQDDLAEMLGYSQKNIAKWEQGYSIPSIDIMIELSKKMKLSLDEILGLNEKSILTKCCEYVDQIEKNFTYQINGIKLKGLDAIKERVSDIFLEIAFAISKDSEKCKDYLKSTLQIYIDHDTMENTILEFLNKNNYLVLEDDFYINADFIDECFDIAEEKMEEYVKENELSVKEALESEDYGYLEDLKSVLKLAKEELVRLLQIKDNYYR